MPQVSLIQFQNRLNDQNVMVLLNVVKILHLITFSQIRN